MRASACSLVLRCGCRRRWSGAAAAATRGQQQQQERRVLGKALMMTDCTRHRASTWTGAAPEMRSRCRQLRRGTRPERGARSNPELHPGPPPWHLHSDSST
ncbi:unnamed protein product [Lampetra fluviatilis]